MAPVLEVVHVFCTRPLKAYSGNISKVYYYAAVSYVYKLPVKHRGRNNSSSSKCVSSVWWIKLDREKKINFSPHETTFQPSIAQQSFSFVRSFRNRCLSAKQTTSKPWHTATSQFKKRSRVCTFTKGVGNIFLKKWGVMPRRAEAMFRLDGERRRHHQAKLQSGYHRSKWDHPRQHSMLNSSMAKRWRVWPTMNLPIEYLSYVLSR